MRAWTADAAAEELNWMSFSVVLSVLSAKCLDLIVISNFLLVLLVSVATLE
jgi:hypothetical protein